MSNGNFGDFEVMNATFVASRKLLIKYIQQVNFVGWAYLLVLKAKLWLIDTKGLYNYRMNAGYKVHIVMNVQ